MGPREWLDCSNSGGCYHQKCEFEDACTLAAGFRRRWLVACCGVGMSCRVPSLGNGCFGITAPPSRTDVLAWVGPSSGYRWLSPVVPLLWAGLETRWPNRAPRDSQPGPQRAGRGYEAASRLRWPPGGCPGKPSIIDDFDSHKSIGQNKQARRIAATEGPVTPRCGAQRRRPRCTDYSAASANASDLTGSTSPPRHHNSNAAAGPEPGGRAGRRPAGRGVPAQSTLPSGLQRHGIGSAAQQLSAFASVAQWRNPFGLAALFWLLACPHYNKLALGAQSTIQRGIPRNRS